MKINNQDFLQIGEVAKKLGVTTRTIRYYEEIGLMSHPKRLDAGIRVYTKDDIKRLKFILKLKELGISLKEMLELAQVYEIHKTPEKIIPKLIEILDNHISKIDSKITKLASLRSDIINYRIRVLNETKEHVKEGEE